MTIPRVPRVGALLLAALLVLSATTVTAASEAAAVPAGANDLLPDMIMARPYDSYLETRPNGQVWLRFGTIGWNVGAGPLEVIGRKPNAGDLYMIVKQRIYQSDGGSRTRRTSAVMYHDGADGHEHYHVRQFITVVLYKVGQGGGDVYGLRKIGFCLLDARRMKNPPAGSPATRQYPFSACGNKSSTRVKTGLSIGWGDDYPPAFAHQFINVTGLPTGRYRMCLTVDPLGEFREANEKNNQRWVDMRISIPNKSVTIKASGGVNDACGPNIA